MHNNFCQSDQIWSFYTSSILGIVHQNKELSSDAYYQIP